MAHFYPGVEFGDLTPTQLYILLSRARRYVRID